MRISDWSSDVCSSDLQRVAVVGAFHATVQGKMLLEDPRAQGDGCGGGGIAQGVIGEAQGSAEAAAEALQHPQVRLLRRQGVERSALQQHQVIVAEAVAEPDRLGNVAELAHAGGKKQRLSGCRNGPDQPQVCRDRQSTRLTSSTSCDTP